MTVLNVSLCLPELDIVALCQKQSIVVVTKRFIVPDKSFALSPCRNFSDKLLDSLYHPKLLPHLRASATSSSLPLMANYWAQCVFCQQVADEEAITTLSERTIWTSKALLENFQNRDRLFLSFLRVYTLPAALPLEAEPTCENLYKFLPLPKYLDVGTQAPILNDTEFAATKEFLLKPESSELNSSKLAEKSSNYDIVEDIVDSPDWVSKISEIGNSSDGHTFERLVRKGLTTLGFSNSLNQSKVSLDPKATGGAGGLDFYANEPYSIVGECKASALGSVRDPVSQLHRLGIRWLKKEGFESSIKLIIAAGKIADYANETAKEHHINVIRPESLQALVELKLKYGNSVWLPELKNDLERPDFGMDADDKVCSLVQRWEIELEKDFKKGAEYFQRGKQIVQTMKELSEQPIHKERKDFLVAEIRAHYNAKYQPCLTDKATRDTLTELSSPFSAGYLGRKPLLGDQERFYFIKGMRPLGS